MFKVQKMHEVEVNREEFVRLSGVCVPDKKVSIGDIIKTKGRVGVVNSIGGGSRNALIGYRYCDQIDGKWYSNNAALDDVEIL